MSTNFLQFNPAANNQETDGQYNGDALRVEGIPFSTSGTIWPSPSANKVLFQLSTMVAALGQFIANQGQNALDSNLANLITAITNAFESLAYPKVITVTQASSVVFTCPPTPTVCFFMTLAGSGTTTSTLVNALPGQLITFFLKGGTGGFSGTFDMPTQSKAIGNPPALLVNNVAWLNFVVLPDGNILPIAFGSDNNWNLISSS